MFLVYNDALQDTINLDLSVLDALMDVLHVLVLMFVYSALLENSLTTDFVMLTVHQALLPVLILHRVLIAIHLAQPALNIQASAQAVLHAAVPSSASSA